jgi:DNA-3-methyladenine glycosylase
MTRLDRKFFERDVLIVAPELIGKVIVRVFKDGSVGRFMITEVEAYRGEEDLACHASKGRTMRNDVMYGKGGLVYVYLCYGMHWMLNFVTEKENSPQAVLIRGIDNISGPGRVTKKMIIDKSYYGEDLVTSKIIWLEDAGKKYPYITAKRVGIDYAGEVWKNKMWRFVMK